jgi:hypothetical protein
MSDEVRAYRVVRTTGIEELEQKVNELIGDGWQPLDGVRLIRDGAIKQVVYVQTMIRRELYQNGRS